MRTRTRVPFFATAFAILLAAAGASSVEAQSVSAADAQDFIGNWTVAIDAQGQVMEMGLNITDDDGNVAAAISSPMGTQPISNISKNDEKLVLSYSADMQGQVIPIAFILTPTDEGLDAEMNVADGMFVAMGKGTRN